MYFQGRTKTNKQNALPLHAACDGAPPDDQGLTEDHKKVITSLITDDQESLQRRNNSGFTPLHIAAMRGSVSKCKVITDYIKTKGDKLEKVVDERGRTPLHIAVMYQKNDVVKYLVDDDFGYVRTRDEKGRTPLDVACELGFFDTVKCIMKTSGITDQYEDTSTNSTPLMTAIENNHRHIMELLLDYGASSNSSNADGESPIHMAIGKNDITMVKRLLDNGANVGFQELAFAIEKGCIEILEEILSKDPSCALIPNTLDTTILHEAVKSEHSRELVAWMRNKHGDILKKIMKSRDTMVGDSEEKTPLGLAVSYHKAGTAKLLLEYLSESPSDDEPKAPTDDQLDVGKTFIQALNSKNRVFVSDILESKFWRIALAQGDFTVEENEPHVLTNPPPLRTLLASMPEIAEMVMWKCIYLENEQNAGNLDIGNCEFDFTFIDDTYTDYYKEKCGIKAQTRYHKRGPNRQVGSLTNRYYEIDTPKTVIKDEHPLMYMIRAIEGSRDDESEKTMALIKHPLILVLIRHMWGRTGRFYLTFLLFYISFTILVSAYMTYVQPPYLPTGENTGCTQQRQTDLGLKIMTGLLWGGGVALEVALVSQQCRMYLKADNISYWIVYLGTILVIAPIECEVPTEWQWHIGALTLLGAWLNVLFLLGWLPVIGIYVNMIKVIFRTFLKFAVLWVVAVMSFAVPHHILFYNQGPFTNLWVSSVKTAVMAFGEFDYTSLFHGEGTEAVLYKHTSRIIFVIFMALMTMIIMNMMIALAVDDVGSLLKQGQIMKLKLLIDMALSVELALPRRIRKYSDTFEQNVINFDAKLNPIEKLLVHFERNEFGNKEFRRLIKDNISKCSRGRLMNRKI